jgi:integrase
MRIDVHLVPFFKNKTINEVTPGLVQEYRVHRLTPRKHPTSGHMLKAGRSTLHQEIVVLRLILKCAHRNRWLDTVPDISTPFRGPQKITHRGWFTHDEYKSLHEATADRIKNPPAKRYIYDYEQLHDFVLFMANTGLRPDEAWRLEYRDVQIVDDPATRKQILEIDVRGKRGVGFCKSMPGAVFPFQRLLKRNDPKPSDLIFPNRYTDLFNIILDELDLKIDREKNRRTFYSLRHTYICFRLLEGADIYNLAKNCRTSVEMIEKYYASHLKNRLDTSTLNVSKPKPRKPAGKKKAASKAKRPAKRKAAGKTRKK